MDKSKELLITKQQLKELWQLPDGKLPVDSTIWKRTKDGVIPRPVNRIGRENLYNKQEVIRLRNEYWGIS